MKEFDKPADRLLEAIKQWHSRTEGKDLTAKELLKEANKILKERVKA